LPNVQFLLEVFIVAEHNPKCKNYVPNTIFQTSSVWYGYTSWASAVCVLTEIIKYPSRI